MILRSLLVLAVTAACAHAQDVVDAPPFAAFDLASDQVLNDPHDLAIGPDGMLYVADKFGNRITVMDPETLEVVRQIAEGGLPGVHDISIMPDGRAIVAVTGQNVAAVISDIRAEELSVEYAYSAPRTEGALLHSNGRAYVMASGVGALVMFDAQELVAVAEGMPGAHDVAEAPNGNVWVADNAQRRIVEYSPDLEFIRQIDALKYGFLGPRYLDFDEFGRLLVADQDAHRVLLIDPEDGEQGRLLGVIGTGEPGIGQNVLDDPEGIVSWMNSYFIADSDNNRIVRYTVVTN